MTVPHQQDKKFTWVSAIALSLSMISTAFCLPFSITPKTGTDFPTTYNGVIPKTAYYTIQNNTHSTRIGNYIQSLPPNAIQVRDNGTYPNTCGAVFNLAKKGEPGDSCTLQLSIIGAINGQTNDPSNLIFACLPGGISCAGAIPSLNIQAVSPWVPISVAYEIIYIGNALSNPKTFLQTYKSGGTNPITTEDEFDAYIPPPDYTKNTPRYLQFNESVFLASPGEPVGTTTYITTEGTPSGYTWGGMSNVINAMWPYDPSQYPSPPSNLGPFEAGNFTTTPPAGVVKVTSNYKAQYMKFYANENGVPPGTPGAVPILRFFILDPWGNEYIMQASAHDTPAEVQSAFEAAVLPEGFTKIQRYLEKDLILMPAIGPGNTFHYQILRDNENSTYHQNRWSSEGVTPANMVQAVGMPIWGGLNNDHIKIVQSFDYTIYGGGGVNTFEFEADLTHGTETIMDFNGNNGDRLILNGVRYSTLVDVNGIHLKLDNGVLIVLNNVFYFDNTWVIG